MTAGGGAASRMGDRKETVLVIDDEPSIRLGLRTTLEQHSYAVLEAGTCEEGSAAFRRTRPDAVILDYLLPDGDALALMEKIREADADVPVIVLTGHASIDLAVRAIKQGAESFLTKPIELPALLVVLQRAVENQRARRRERAERTGRGRQTVDPFLGESAAVRDCREKALRVVSSDRPVLILGETGAGKGVLARWLHESGPRSRAAFVGQNCAALSRELLESELFGHAKGAFTGADRNKMGLVEMAHRGTLFLDEIGDVDAAIQPKLLTVIEDMRFRRLGEVRDLLVDVRIVAATHQNLADLVQRKLFRADLYFRINTLPLRVPPLRERTEDIPILARHFVALVGEELGRGEVSLGRSALAALGSYAWPGNIRELRNVLERAVLLSDARELSARDLIFEASVAPSAPPAGDMPGPGASLADVERWHVLRVLEAEGGGIPQAAERLGVPRSTLYGKLRAYGIDSPRRRRAPARTT